MPPQLTEAWGTAYLHILIILLVFAYGIPFLLYQIIIPEEVRLIVDQYKGNLLIFFMAFLISIISLCFVWVLHPCSTGVTPIWHDWLSAGLISVAIVITICCWLRYVRVLSKVNIAHYLEKRLRKSIFTKSRLSEVEIADLISLGERGESGSEKDAVLQVMDRVAQRMQAVPKYSGCELEYLLRNIDLVITNKEKQGSYDNFYSGVKILRNIRDRLNERKMLLVNDASLVSLALERIALSAIEADYVSIVLFIVQILNDGRTLFKIGLSAIMSKRLFLALAILNKLEAFALEKIPISAEKSVHALGFLAHFWHLGENSKIRVEWFFNTYKNNFAPSLPVCLNQALDHYRIIAEYDTADKLTIMRDKIVG